MANKYLDLSGVEHLWNKIVEGFVAKETGKGLSANDFTTELKNKLNGLSNYTHPSYTTKASGLYKITVDATGHISDATAVTKTDITGLGIPGSVPTKVSQLTNDSKFQTDAQVSAAIADAVSGGTLDLSGYLKTTDMVAITTSEIDAIIAG